MQANTSAIDAPNGAMIDLFTQKEPYSGRGINESSDAFAPQEEVVLYASVTYNGEPVAGKLVGFLIYGPPNPYNNITDSRGGQSDESGIAMTSFRLGSYDKRTIFGTWFVQANVEIAQKVVTDTLTFRVGYIVEITSIDTIDENLKPKTCFAKATCVGVKLHIRNIAMLPKTATIVVSAYDAFNTLFDSFMLNNFDVEPGETYIFAHCFLNISEQAAIGNAMVNASAFTAPPSMGGILYCPTVSADFVITLRNVAVINVTTSSIDVIEGQIVNVTATVANNGNETETFSVSAYYGPFLIQTLSVDSLSPNQNKTLTFVWNTTYVPAGSYVIKAAASTVPGETDTGDNTYIDSTVTVRVPRIFMFPRELSIIALIVAAALALFGIILLITRKKNDPPQAVTLTVDVLPS